MKKHNSFLKLNIFFSAMFIILIAIDRLTKQWAIDSLRIKEWKIIPGFFSFHYLENRGAAWGILQNATAFFVIITIVILAVMVYFYGKIPTQNRYHLLRFSILILAAGAFGNFIDRIQLGYVVDFIYVECISFPVFNIADCYVCIAAVLLLYCLLYKYKDEEFLWKKKN